MSTPFVPFVDGSVPKAADFNQLAKSAFDNAAQTALDKLATAADRVQTGSDRTAAATSASDALGYRNTAQGVAAAFGDVQGAVDAAAAQAGIATTGAGTATTQAGLAVAAKTAAEAARDAAMVTGKVYASTAAGLAATTTTQYFSVPSPDSAESLILYLNSAGAAVEQKRYPSSQAVTAILARVGTDVGAPLEESRDLIGNVYRRTNADGGMELPGLKKTVQATFADLPAQLGNPAVAGDVLQLQDSAGGVTLRQNANGEVFVPGIAGPLQSALGGVVGVVGYPVRTMRDRLAAEVIPYFADLAANRIDYAPPPALLLPNGMHVSNAIVNSFSLSVPAPTPLNTPYANNDLVVHPHLIEMPRPFRGYRYILGQTPYSSGRMENPIVFGSNDLISFTLLQDMPQPLALPSSSNENNYLSDVAFTYDPVNGDLICIYRQVLYTPGTSTVLSTGIWYRRTRNGYTWTAARLCREYISSDTGILSPAILFNPADGLWHMWSVPMEGALSHMTAPTLEGPWTEVSLQNTVAIYGIRAWHLEVKFMGNKLMMLLNQRIPGSNLYFGISNDGNTWEFGSPLITPEQDGTYKASFVPEFNGNQLTMVIAWSTNITINPAHSRRFFIARTNTISIT